MAVNSRLNVIFDPYARKDPPQGLPTEVEALLRYTHDELQKVGRVLNDLAESCPQVADREPANKRVGMQRYAITPWDPGSGSDTWYYWDGAAWALL